jgi:hypothetical protein
MLIFANTNLCQYMDINPKIFGQTIAGSDALFAILYEHIFFEVVACWGKQCDLYFFCK